MTTTELKEKLLANTTEDVANQLTPTVHAIIDETIEDVIKQASTKTEEELIMSILDGMKVRIKMLSVLVSESEKHVQITYRGVKIK